MLAGHKGVAKASFFTSTIAASYDYFLVMRREKAQRKETAKKPHAAKHGSVLVCALCGSAIKSTLDAVGDGTVIYSICPACKLAPPRRYK
jgi:hypothetical protein